jgi:L-ascorbate metabolism protein UlaG (beta-lactamase superfamily)
VIAPERLDFIDVATSTHNHTDHLDAYTLGPLLEANPDLTLVVPAANRAFAADRLGVAPNRLTGLTAGASVEAAGFRLHGVPAAHETLERDDEGRHTFMGFVAEFGPHTVYHSGDTVRFDGQVEALAPFDIDVALLPINGGDHPAPSNLDGDAAAQLAKDIGASLAVPCHFEMFEFNTVPPDAFEAAAERLGQPFRTLRAGERLGM